MTKKQYVYTLRNEVAKLNKRIDQKILLGYAYSRDAHRHRELLQAIKRVSRRERITSWVKSVFAAPARIGFRPGFTMF